MPIVEIKFFGPLSMDKRKQIAKEVTKSIEVIASKPKESISIHFVQMDEGDLFKSGELISNPSNNNDSNETLT